MTLEEKFLKIKRKFKDGCTTTAELNKLNFKNYEINRLCEKGHLVRFRQGVYIVKNGYPVDKQKLIIKIIPEAVFCYNYAWCLCWGKRFPKTIHIAVPRNISRSKCKAIEGIDLIIHYLPEDLYRQDIDNKKLPHYNTERTICDLFKYHRFKSERWLSDTTREYVDNCLDPKKLNKLIACAKKLHIDKEGKRLMKKYLWERAEWKYEFFKYKDN